MKIIFILLSLWCALTANAADFTLSSPSLISNHPIPTIFTCDGGNISPKLSWANPPANTVSYALELYSPDSVVGVYYNWILYNIPATQTALPEAANKDLSDDIMSASNTAGDTIYRGPCPPDTGYHHYVFEIFALNARLDLSGTEDVDEITRTINKHKIQSATLTVLFNH